LPAPKLGTWRVMATSAPVAGMGSGKVTQNSLPLSGNAPRLTPRRWQLVVDRAAVQAGDTGFDDAGTGGAAAGDGKSFEVVGLAGVAARAGAMAAAPPELRPLTSGVMALSCWTSMVGFLGLMGSKAQPQVGVS